MFRRVSAASLLCAWLCASGALLDLAQAFAWGRMFAGYARAGSVASALTRTFDPCRPCAICRAVSRARDDSRTRAPAVASAGAQKMVLVLDAPPPFAAPFAPQGWPVPPSTRGEVRGDDVPVPPPRAALA